MDDKRPSRTAMEQDWDQNIKEIRSRMKRDIITRLGVYPRVDVFGSDNHTFMEAWKGMNSKTGGEAHDHNWKTAGLLFLCPPTNKIHKVVKLVKLYNIKAVIVFPNWGEEVPWYHEVWSLVKKYYLYKENVKLWVGVQPPWSTYVALLDASVETMGDNQGMVAQIDVATVQTVSSKRRRRRKKQLKAIQKQKKHQSV